MPRPLLHLSLRVEQPGVTAEPLEEVWLVSQPIGAADAVAYAMAARQRAEKLTLMPYGGAAALLARRAYASLPLPISTDLPVHLHGRWEIASDRNALAPDDALPRHEWNLRLAGRVCAAAYARLLRERAGGYRLTPLDLSTSQVRDLPPLPRLPQIAPHRFLPRCSTCVRSPPPASARSSKAPICRPRWRPT